MNRAFLLLVLFVTFARLVFVQAANTRNVNVFVTCDGRDIVGARLCLAVKDQILSSSDLQLVKGANRKDGHCRSSGERRRQPGKVAKRYDLRSECYLHIFRRAD